MADAIFPYWRPKGSSEAWRESAVTPPPEPPTEVEWQRTNMPGLSVLPWWVGPASQAALDAYLSAQRRTEVAPPQAHPSGHLPGAKLTTYGGKGR